MGKTENVARLRGELDQLDDKILALVEQRLVLCRRIGLSKESSSALKLDPSRQQAIVKRLQARASRDAAQAVPHIWREIMAHGVQAQGQLRFLIPNHPDGQLLLRLVRDQYGSAAPVEWVEGSAEAVRRAQAEDVVAVLHGREGGDLPHGLKAFDLLGEGQDVPIGRLAGRVSVEAAPRRQWQGGSRWSLTSWRRREALQQPVYADAAGLEEVERRLAARPPLVELHDVDALRQRLGEAAQRKAILIQGGDCVETFREHSAEKVRLTAALLLELGQILGDAAERRVVHVGRIAGQFAKPRSAATEMAGGLELPTYRGDGVNGEEGAPEARRAEPRRLLQAHDQAAATMRQLWDRAPIGSEPIYTSHEALLLNVEQALTQFDELTGRWWAGSGHMLWIGDRTRQLDGAHIEYARGIANPIGLKCGPSLGANELLGLIDRLDPDNEPGRLTLIPRLGRGFIEHRLAELMRKVAQEGRNPLWCVDPMHGNTRVVDGRKVRLLEDITAETIAFHEIAAAEGAWPGGLHLELTGTDVLECTGGKRRLIRWGARQRYRSGCDPRLNPAQARDLAEVVAGWHAPAAGHMRMCG